MRLWKNRTKMRNAHCECNNKNNNNNNNNNRSNNNNNKMLHHLNLAFFRLASDLQISLTALFYLSMVAVATHADIITKFTESSPTFSQEPFVDTPSPAVMPPAVAAAQALTASSSAATATLASFNSVSSHINNNNAAISPFVEPYLDGSASSNVTTQIGTHAYLPCRVKQLGNKSVSWIRVRDGHILTVDRAVFIADQRFTALKQPDKFWTLQIKYVQARDAGAYECQVSTEPKVSARVHLDVVVPRTEILGDSDRYVKAGSTVFLRCVVRGALEPPTFIMWYHGSEQLAADSKRHRTHIERKASEKGGEDETVGALIIESVKKRDTGNYTCSPSNSPSVTVTLNVINGESSASAVTSSAPVSKSYTACMLVSLLCCIAITIGKRDHGHAT